MRVKTHRVRPSLAAEWRPRGSRGTECGSKKCSSANQVNGAHFYWALSFLRGIPDVVALYGVSGFVLDEISRGTRRAGQANGTKGEEKFEGNYMPLHVEYIEWLPSIVPDGVVSMDGG